MIFFRSSGSAAYFCRLKMISNCSPDWCQDWSMQTFDTSGKPRARSEEALLNSAASSRPRSIAGTISAPGSAFTAAPRPLKMSIERPTVRYLRPLKSSAFETGFMNQPSGWFKTPVSKADDFKGLKYRTVGLSIDIFNGLGAAVNALPGAEIVPAMDRGLLDAAEFNNASSDRALGFPD